MAANYEATAVKTVEVSKDDLAAQLKKNLEKHRGEYAEAMVGWKGERRALIVVLRDACNNHGEKIDVINEAYSDLEDLEEPEDHGESYVQAIELMKWETRDTVTLSINDFECYVRDNWGWKGRHQVAVRNFTSSIG